jgi:hypothetical protein
MTSTQEKRIYLRNLSVMAYAMGVTLWVYKATVLENGQSHDLETCLTPGYFNAAESMFRAGDPIYIIHEYGAWHGYVALVHTNATPSVILQKF